VPQTTAGTLIENSPQQATRLPEIFKVAKHKTERHDNDAVAQNKTTP
jgi:hypothetical protein